MGDDFAEMIGAAYSEDSIMRDEDMPQPEYAHGYVFVNVYDLDRHQGGREEGGWWFDTGRIVRSIQVPASLADGYVDQLEKEYPPGDRYAQTSRYCVNYPGTGDYSVRIEDKPGEDFSDWEPYS